MLADVQHSENIKALINYRQTVSDPIEGLKALLLCAKNFHDLELTPLAMDLLQLGPQKFIEEYIPDPLGREAELEKWRHLYELITHAYRNMHDTPIDSDEETSEKKQLTDILKKQPPFYRGFRYPLSKTEEKGSFLELLYKMMLIFWEKLAVAIEPKTETLEYYLSSEAGVHLKNLTNAGFKVSTFQSILNIEESKQQAEEIKLLINEPTLPSVPRKISCLSIIIGLGNWGDDVHTYLKKFGYDLSYWYDHELALTYLLTQEAKKTGRENLEWINTIYKLALDPVISSKHCFTLAGS